MLPSKKCVIEIGFNASMFGTFGQNNVTETFIAWCETLSYKIVLNINIVYSTNQV